MAGLVYQSISVILCLTKKKLKNTWPCLTGHPVTAGNPEGREAATQRGEAGDVQRGDQGRRGREGQEDQGAREQTHHHPGKSEHGAF